MASWQLPPPERIPSDELQSILAGLRWRRNAEHDAAYRRADQDHTTVAPEDVTALPCHKRASRSAEVPPGGRSARLGAEDGLGEADKGGDADVQTTPTPPTTSPPLPCVHLPVGASDPALSPPHHADLSTLPAPPGQPSARHAPHEGTATDGRGKRQPWPRGWRRPQGSHGRRMAEGRASATGVVGRGRPQQATRREPRAAAP
jgi:hypothetical protein